MDNPTKRHVLSASKKMVETMHNKYLFILHEGMEYLGPSSPECTQKAFSLVEPLTDNASVLEIGAGTGRQTLQLLDLCRNCRITAVDIHRPFLDAIEKKAENICHPKRLKTVCSSMDNLNFEKESFDLVWAEGAVFIMGFSAGVSYWKQFLKAGGYMVVSDLIWFTKSPSGEAEAFWKKNYPKMGDMEDKIQEAESAGYEVIETFRLPKSGWDNYLIPLQDNLDALEKKYGGDPKADSLIMDTRNEAEFYHRHKGEFGYCFFILKNTKKSS